MNNKKHTEDILYYFEKYHYESMILDDNEAKFIHDYIINLQSKEDYFYDNKTKDPCGNDNTFNDSKNKLLSILKEDK